MRVQLQTHTPEEADDDEAVRNTFDVVPEAIANAKNDELYDMTIHNRFGKFTAKKPAVDQLEEDINEALEWVSDDNLLHTVIVARGKPSVVHPFLNSALKIRNHLELLNYLEENKKHQGLSSFNFPTHMNYDEPIIKKGRADIKHMTDDEFVERLEHLDMVEVYTGIVERINEDYDASSKLDLAIDNGKYLQYSGGEPDASSKLDLALDNGKYLLAVASDDAHSIKDFGRAWINVFYDKKFNKGNKDQQSEVFSNILKGNFYPTTGVVLNVIRRKDDTIQVASENAQRVKVIGNPGGVLFESALKDGRFEFELTDEVTKENEFIRLEFFGTKSSGKKTKAWTQPFRTKIQ